MHICLSAKDHLSVRTGTGDRNMSIIGDYVYTDYGGINWGSPMSQ